MNNNKGAQKCEAYHHGNLRDALIVAASELIERTGSLDFAMTDCAKLVGVSSAAPYRHFKDKDELLQAVCQVAFIALGESFEEIAEQHPLGSTQRIVALGQGYIEFLTSHPQFYELMWGKSGIAEMQSGPSDPGGSGFYVLSEAVHAWCGEQGIEGLDPTNLATKLWAFAHGLSGITLNGHIKRFLPDTDVNDLLESSTKTFLDGLIRDS